jgi:hypothetical protein
MSADALDAVLERFAVTGPEFGGGLSNHGPMASEALVALGRADAVERWAEEYASQLVEHPESRNPIARNDWREALGDVARVGDWIPFFEREIADQPWAVVLENWVPRLSPGIMAAATHGILRTAHAVRALGAGETPARLHEFAEGLGYWAARYQELPGRPGTSQRLAIADAVAHVRRNAGAQQGRLLIFDAVRALDEEHFGPAIDLVTANGRHDLFISELTSVFARLFIVNASNAAIGFVHTVTAPSALRTLEPHLSAETSELAMRYVWQACAAIYATYGRVDSGDLLGVIEPQPFDREELIERAIATRDEHAIKFTEACLREHALSHDHALIVAATAMLAGRERRS